MDKKRNEYIRETSQVEMAWRRREARLRWFGHVQEGMMDILEKGCCRWSCHVGERPQKIHGCSERGHAEEVEGGAQERIRWRDLSFY